MNRKILSVGVMAIIGGAAWHFLPAEKFESINAISTPLPEVAAQVGSVDRNGPLPLPAGTKPPWVSAPDTLDNSDTAVIKALTDLSPRLIQWLMPEAQIRKWVMLVDQIADGAIPQMYRPINYPISPFTTRREGEQLLLDPSNYTRANLLIDVVTAVPPARLAPYYRTWYPRLNEAYRELGRGGGFDKRLRVAIDNVLATQPLPDIPELVRPSVYYRYADAKYENASDLQKFMWRIGPDNALRLQRYLRELEQAL